MNKQCFRVIFSKTLQRFVVVSELAKTDGKAESESDSSGGVLQKICKMRPIVLSLFTVLGSVSVVPISPITAYTETKRSGLLNGGKIGFTIGSQKVRQESTLDGTLQSTARNTLASEGGNIRIQANNHVNINNADMITAKEKTIAISGKNGVMITGETDAINHNDKFAFSQSGLSFSLSTPVTDAVQSAQQSVKKSKATPNDKLKGVYAMKAAEEAVIAAQHAQKVAETLGNLGGMLTENNAAAENSAVKIAVSLGTQKQESESKTTTVTHTKS